MQPPQAFLSQLENRIFAFPISPIKKGTHINRVLRIMSKFQFIYDFELHLHNCKWIASKNSHKKVHTVIVKLGVYIY